MSYTSITFLIVGITLVLYSVIRFRGLMTEGMYQVYRGELVKVERWEQPKTYWANVAMMGVTSAAGVFLISQVNNVVNF